MRVHIAAVTHFDPLARRRLGEWMRRASITCPSVPTFVAVEWASHLFQLVHAQRGRFIEISRARWPTASEALLDELSRTMGFEADTHSKVWPDVPTLWLDDERRLTHEELRGVQTHAEQRMVVYRSWLEDQQPPPDTEAALMFISAMAETVTRGVVMPNGHARDETWASAVETAAASRGGWALAVVGSGHVDGAQTSFASRLRAAGFEVQVHYMFERY